MNIEKILDSLIGTKSTPVVPSDSNSKPRSFIEEALSAFGLGGDRQKSEAPSQVGQIVSDTRDTLGGWGDSVKEAMGRNPTLTAGALATTAGMLLSGRGRGLLGSIAGIGGIGLIGSLAYNAYRKYQERNSGTPPIDQQALNPARATEEDAHLFARAMVAAIASDGRMDAVESARVAGGLREAGLEHEGAAWLEKEFATPANVEELAGHASTPEKASQIYSAARLVIEPDTKEERDFLDRLAQALRLEPALRSAIDGGALELKTST